MADLLVVALLLVALLGVFSFFEDGEAPSVRAVVVDTSLRRLPYYSLLSLTRSFIALALSYLFAIGYGKLAAKKRLDTLLVPLLDVLQSLPVLAFLPGFVLTLISIFRGSRWGLELACVLMIFTGQAWNLAFAFYESQRTLPAEYRELSRIAGFNRLERLLIVEVPHGITPLIYNGMMSMAGGWFFLTLCENFVLGGRSYTLPGLGAYLATSLGEGNYVSFASGISALAFMIFLVDFTLWRPLLAWSTSFRDTMDAEGGHQSRFLELIKSSSLHHFLLRFVSAAPDSTPVAKPPKPFRPFKRGAIPLRGLPNLLPRSPLQRRFLAGMAMGTLIFLLLPQIPVLARSTELIASRTWRQTLVDLGYTSCRVFGVLLLSSLWTIPVGFLIGRNRKLASRALPVVQNLAAFPAPVFFPLIAMLLSRFSLQPWLIALLLMAMGNQWYMLFNVVSAVARIPGELVLMGRSFQFSRSQMIFKVYLPSMLPSLITGWMTCAGGCWNASIVAEIIEYAGGKIKCQGIGADIAQATTEGDYPKLMACIIVIVITLILLNRTVWYQLNRIAEGMKA